MQLFSNNVITTVATAINDTVTTLVVADGSDMPSPTGGDYFLLTLYTLNSNGQENAWEIIKVTARTTNTLTIVRAQEGTIGLSWGIGAPVQLRATAGPFTSAATHSANVANPHTVTKTQVGLSNADNTSDVNKPVSTAQQTALNLKANLTANTFTAAQELSTGSNIASASTINLNTATGNRVHITGTTTITAVTLTRGPRTVIFDGILTLTHHVTNNNLPGAANIITAAGDRAIYESDGTTVYCVDYIKANGTSVIESGTPGLTLLSTVTASLSTTVDVEWTAGSYDRLLLIGEGILPETTNTILHIKLKVGGTYIATSNYNNSFEYSDVGVTAQQTSNNNEAVIRPNVSPSKWSTAGSKGAIDIEINNPDISQIPTIFYKLYYPVSSTETAYIKGVANLNTIGVLTGIRISFSTDTVSVGTFRLYGVKQ